MLSRLGTLQKLRLKVDILVARRMVADNAKLQKEMTEQRKNFEERVRNTITEQYASASGSPDKDMEDIRNREEAQAEDDLDDLINQCTECATEVISRRNACYLYVEAPVAVALRKAGSGSIEGNLSNRVPFDIYQRLYFFLKESLRRGDDSGGDRETFRVEDFVLRRVPPPLRPAAEALVPCVLKLLVLEQELLVAQRHVRKLIGDNEDLFSMFSQPQSTYEEEGGRQGNSELSESVFCIKEDFRIEVEALQEELRREQERNREKCKLQAPGSDSVEALEEENKRLLQTFRVNREKARKRMAERLRRRQISASMENEVSRRANDDGTQPSKASANGIVVESSTASTSHTDASVSQDLSTELNAIAECLEDKLSTQLSSGYGFAFKPSSQKHRDQLQRRLKERRSNKGDEGVEDGEDGEDGEGAPRDGDGDHAAPPGESNSNTRAEQLAAVADRLRAEVSELESIDKNIDRERVSRNCFCVIAIANVQYYRILFFIHSFFLSFIHSFILSFFLSFALKGYKT